jgi:hypothetical protein
MPGKQIAQPLANTFLFASGIWGGTERTAYTYSGMADDSEQIVIPAA